VYRNSEHIRVAGINAPELNTDVGKAARDAARSLLAPGDLVTVTSQAKPSFERTVGSITIHRDVGDVDFADAMVEAGHAVRV
jgi:endonuclease YncB( thermonuclease family)